MAVSGEIPLEKLAPVLSILPSHLTCYSTMRSVPAAWVVALGASFAWAQQGPWGQCGGQGWTGATTCVSGWTCVYSNPWYSQCLQGAAATTTTKTTTTSSPLSSTTTKVVSTSKASTTLAVSTTSATKTTTSATRTPTAAGNYPGPTLLSGYLWIRAVEAPHFHEYLQTSGNVAVIASHTTAGQFNVVSGQLVQTTASGLLYANVEQRSDASDMLLGVTFSSTKNTFGTFAFSGDALQWTVPSITRPNPSAWYVCGNNNQLFINLGQYLYGTPSGCADETIHFYNGATADA